MFIFIEPFLLLRSIFSILSVLPRMDSYSLRCIYDLFPHVVDVYHSFICCMKKYSDNLVIVEHALYFLAWKSFASLFAI